MKNFFKFFYYIFLIIVFFGLGCDSTTEKMEKYGSPIDRSVWSKKSKEWKEGYIEGWRSGGYLSFGLYPKISDKVEYLNGKDGRSRYISEKLMGKIIFDHYPREMGFDLSKLKMNQILNMIDQVYSNPKLKDASISGIMPLVRGRLKEGWTEQDIDAVLAYRIRLHEISKECLQIRDYTSIEAKACWENLHHFEETRKPGVLKEIENY